MSTIKLSDLDKPGRYAIYRDAVVEKVKEHQFTRRVHLGPFLTISFESLTTVSHLIQERIYHNDINSISEMQHEIELKSPLIPQVGLLSATLYIDLATETEVTEWLPKLQGAEKSIYIEFPDGVLLQAAVGSPQGRDSTHHESASRSSHIVWHLTEQQRMLFADGPPSLAVIHPGYSYRVPIPQNLHADLFREVSGTVA